MLRLLLFLLILSSAEIGRGEKIVDSLVKCCSEARMEVGKRSSCDNIAEVLSAVQMPVRSRPFCNYLASVCCENGLREIECTNGIDAGRQNEGCDSGPTDDFQKCCELCKMGVQVGKEGESCDLGKATFGSFWESAFTQCCEAENPYLQTTPEQDSDGETTRNMCDLLPGELCAHGCTPVGSSYKCFCRPGYTLMSDGKSCSPLSSQRCGGCSHGCEERTSGSICTCPEGFYLANDSRTCIERALNPQPWTCPPGYRPIANYSHLCQDVDECTEGISGCDPIREKCINSIGSFTCLQKPKPLKCKRGFQYSEHHNACLDIDECKDEEDPPCDSNQRCENTDGSYVCFCKPGFRQDPITLACIDVNECALRLHNCGPFQRCDNLPGSFVCVRDVSCGTGYTLNSHSGKCEDDDECMLETHNCHVQGPEWECHNTMGSFRCLRKPTTTTTPRPLSRIISTTTPRSVPSFPFSPERRACPVGFKLEGNFCTDVNECEEGTARCNPGQKCRNIQGAYLCSNPPKCRAGYKLNSDGTKCTDINECAEQPGVCSQKCVNLWGSYVCRCNDGFKLGPDNRVCIDVNECEMGVRCQGHCVNEPGSYSCQCPPGYVIGTNKHSCRDIDECEGTSDLCDKETESCVNIHGSYRCGLVVCPHGFRKDPDNSMRCLRDLRCSTWEDVDCIRQPTHTSFNFISMTSNYTLPASGALNLFAVESSFGSIPPNYTMEIVQVRAPPGIEAASSQHFYLKKQSGVAILQLVKPVIGPQDIQIEIKTEFVMRNRVHGGTLHSLDLYISQYPF